MRGGADIKTVGVKELKNNLSAYLREVRRGTRILVADRTTIVAELREPTLRDDLPEASDPLLSDWIREQLLVAPSRKKTALPASPVHLEEGAAQRLLDEDREERRS